MLKHFFLPTLLILSSFYFSAAQEAGRVTELDVELQQTFIEGTREKILGNFEKSASLYEQVLTKDKQNDAAAYELARVYDAIDDNEKAIKFAKKAVELETSNIWYQMFLADLYQKLNQDEKAANIYETLVELEPNDDYYYFKWAYFLVRANQPEQAIKVYESLEKRMGINEELTRRKHTLYLGLGNYKKAAKELEELIEAFPKKLAYRHLLANFYEQIGETALAKNIYKEILQIDPSDTRANLAVADNAKDGNVDVRFLRTLVPIFEKREVHIDVKISELLPYILKVTETNDLELADAALELTEIIENVHPNDAKGFSASADLFYHSGRIEEAIEKYKETLELNETVYAVWESLLYAYADLKQFENLIETSENALDLFPNQASIYYLNGLGYSKLGKHKDALSSLQQALMMTGRRMDLKFQIQALLGNEYFALKQFPKSDKAFETALEINNNEATLLNDYSYCLSERGEQLDKAKQLATKANELAPNTSKYQHTLGLVSYKMKDYKIAKEWLNKALKTGGISKPQILEHYGDVLFQLGEEDEAVNYWQQALDKGEKSERLEKKIAEKKLHE